MKIRMKSLAAGPNGVLREGQVYESPNDLSDQSAQELVAGGYAEVVRTGTLETADAPVEPVEVAVPARPRGRGRTPKEG